MSKDLPPCPDEFGDGCWATVVWDGRSGGSGAYMRADWSEELYEEDISTPFHEFYPMEVLYLSRDLPPCPDEFGDGCWATVVGDVSLVLLVSGNFFVRKKFNPQFTSTNEPVAETMKILPIALLPAKPFSTL